MTSIHLRRSFQVIFHQFADLSETKVVFSPEQMALVEQHGFPDRAMSECHFFSGSTGHERPRKFQT